MIIPIDKILTHKRIVACSACDATGVSQHSELVDYHRGEYDSWLQLCSACGGEGRLLRITYHSAVQMRISDNIYSSHTIEHSYTEQLEGRLTADIYTVK